MRKTAAFFLLLHWITLSILGAQQAHFIEGKVFDKETKDPLPAYIMMEGAEAGVTADDDGKFKLPFELQEEYQKVKLIVWIIGYKKKEIDVTPGKPVTIELELEPPPSHEVVVTADSIVAGEKSQKTVTLTQMDVYTLPGTAADPVYASHVLPGVNSIPDASNMLIRGGSPDEVIYVFDGIEVDHPFLSESLHESYFSIFDNQIIENFSVSTSGFHPKYGDAVSGVMDITAKDTILKGEGGIGLSIFGLNCYVGLPVKNIGSFAGSYNRGHSFLMTRINGRDENTFSTQNAFAKFHIKLHKNHSLRVLGLFDTYSYTHEEGFNTKSHNGILGFSLTSVFSSNWISKFTFSQLFFDVSYSMPENFETDIKDGASQIRFDSSLDLDAHFLTFGADLQTRNVDVTVIEDRSDLYRTKGTRTGFYFNDKFRLFDKLYLNLGGRMGALDLDSHGVNFDPRFSLAYFVTRKDILRFSAGLYHQYGDYFAIEENDLKPKYAHHYSLSYDRAAENSNIRITLYDKGYRNLFLNCGEGSVSNDGLGFARGAEFYIKQDKTKYTFLFVYNFLSSKRKEYDVRTLARSPYEIDHSLTGILTIKFKNASVGFRYSYASGLPYTPLLDREWDEHSQAYFPVWGEPYSVRYPAYQRLDITGSATAQIGRRMIIFYLGLTNVLNNKNILRYEYSDNYAIRRESHSIFGRSVFIGIYIPFF
jgi:hypothetical protein